MVVVKVFLLVLLCGSVWSRVVKMDIPSELLVPAHPITASSLPAGTETKYLSVVLDHFSFAKSETFKLRYLINTKNWKAGKPIFFYTGNEGAIELFAENTGFMWDIAPEYNAMVVFAEHRYYGQSQPFGKDSYKDRKHFGYLTAEQALADFVDVITHIKANVTGAAKSKVIAFGGSYGGMLAAWIRQKYPNVVDGSIAASAPVLMFPGIEPLGCGGFSIVTTRAYTLADSKCPPLIRKSWDLIYKATTAELTKTFNLCSKLNSQQALAGYLNNAIVDMAMGNYPYPANFIANLPAWPVAKFCGHLVSYPTQILQGMSKAIGVYYNTSGTQKCLNLSQSQAPTLGASGWNYQSCMEMVMPMCSDGKNDMFLPSKWDYKAVASSCESFYGVTPRPNWIVKEFWGNLLASRTSNILFSNGDLDPWSSGGLTKSPNPNSLPVVLIKNGAHHLDLRASNPLDPKSVTDARKLEKSWIDKWIK